MWEEQNKIFPACVHVSARTRTHLGPEQKGDAERMKWRADFPSLCRHSCWEHSREQISQGWQCQGMGKGWRVTLAPCVRVPDCSWHRAAAVGICQGGWALCKPQMHQGCGVSAWGKIHGESLFPWLWWVEAALGTQGLSPQHQWQGVAVKQNEDVPSLSQKPTDKSFLN